MAAAANKTLGSNEINPVCESIADYKIRPGDSLKEAQIKQGDFNVVEQEKVMPFKEGTLIPLSMDVIPSKQYCN